MESGFQNPENFFFQGLVWRLKVSWIWWFYETFWDLIEREKPTLSFFSKLEVLEVSVERCRSTDVLMAPTIFRPSPVSSAVTRVLFPFDQVNWYRPLPPYIKNSSVADEKCAISLVSHIIVPQVMLPSEADFNQLVKYESDSDCIEVDSTDYDSEELVNGKPVVRSSGRQAKAWIRFDV